MTKLSILMISLLAYLGPLSNNATAQNSELDVLISQYFEAIDYDKAVYEINVAQMKQLRPLFLKQMFPGKRLNKDAIHYFDERMKAQAHKIQILIRAVYSNEIKKTMTEQEVREMVRYVSSSGGQKMQKIAANMSKGLPLIILRYAQKMNEEVIPEIKKQMIEKGYVN